MRVIAPLPRPAGKFKPVTAVAAPRESVVVTWCREIATNTATSVGSPVENAEYLLTPYPHGFAPYSLYSSFVIAGRTVTITVLWDDLFREPGFALAIDGQPVPLDATSTARPAAVIAHAAWQAILTPSPGRAS
ncbi:hypothetical protein KIF24_28570 [Micromonospora sp. Llam7]|uniref:hypothetical protein n=1 Tax=Micromonospora tarapacensis TaxID=2835305 RepID=UPI001C829BF2|nr:hypothetical protein [Micromonospora tarapacensis]MBX7269574.1 hypothetical protein [Micromonospora tarapacensis]